jgi:hypothetical protein
MVNGDDYRKTGAILKSDFVEARRKDIIALEKMKVLEKKMLPKMRTVKTKSIILQTTRKESEFETYDPFSYNAFNE